MFFACILLSFATDTPFGINVFHVIQIHFGNKHRCNRLHYNDKANLEGNTNNQLQSDSRPKIEDVKEINLSKITSKRRKVGKKKSQISSSSDSESEGNVHEEIKVCILRKNKKASKKYENKNLPALEDSKNEIATNDNKTILNDDSLNSAAATNNSHDDNSIL